MSTVAQSAYLINESQSLNFGSGRTEVRRHCNLVLYDSGEYMKEAREGIHDSPLGQNRRCGHKNVVLGRDDFLRPRSGAIGGSRALNQSQ